MKNERRKATWPVPVQICPLGPGYQFVYAVKLTGQDPYLEYLPAFALAIVDWIDVSLEADYLAGREKPSKRSVEVVTPHPDGGAGLGFGGPDLEGCLNYCAVGLLEPGKRAEDVLRGQIESAYNMLKSREE